MALVWKLSFISLKLKGCWMMIKNINNIITSRLSYNLNLWIHYNRFRLFLETNWSKHSLQHSGNCFRPERALFSLITLLLGSLSSWYKPLHLSQHWEKQKKRQHGVYPNNSICKSRDVDLLTVGVLATAEHIRPI